MDWLFENLGPIAFSLFFVLPLVRRITQNRKQKEKERAKQKPDPRVQPKKPVPSSRSGEGAARAPSEKQKQPFPENIPPEKKPRVSPSLPPSILTAEKDIPSLSMPSAEADWSLMASPSEEEDTHQKNKVPSSLKRITRLPRLKQGVIWKEILDPPRGF